MAKGTSGARKFVTGSIVNIAIIGGLILGAGYAAKKLNLGSKITESLQGAGATAGQGILAPITGIVQGFTQGGEALAQQLGQTQNAIFNQGAITTDNFNKFFHPDWYNSDGSYSAKNPNYDPSKPGNGNPTFNSSLTNTSPSGQTTAAATGSSANIGGTTSSRTTNTSPSTLNVSGGSNLVYTQASNILSGTAPNVNLAGNTALQDAFNSLISKLTVPQASAVVGQTVVGNYKLPNGSVLPLTQDAVNYYNSKGIRITRV